MIDKSLVKKRFTKSLLTYDENAVIQKAMAKKLISLLPYKEYNSILEIGCSTGILTRYLQETISFNKFTSNDIVQESKTYIDKIIPNNVFINGDIEEINFEDSFDLIISNACFQWCNNIEKLIDKLTNRLNDNGLLLFSIFGDNNLSEIKQLFQIENNNYKTSDLKNFIKKYNANLFEEEIKLYFETPVDILKHLKLTGVNAIKEYKLTKTKLKEFEKDYSINYKEQNKYYITYNPVYITIQK